MLISCNQLKKYIKYPEDIDFKTIWDTFTMKTAEVEAVFEKGVDLKDVVTAKIVACEKHPDSKKLSLLKVSDGTEVYDIVCGAPNVRVGLVGALVKEGGMVSGQPITARKLAGYMSHGMMCALDELGLGTDHEGILELDEDTPLGVDLKDLYPIRDIVVEIDNKSLTNRPDLWGHYGIAREIAAITNHELLPLEVYEGKMNSNDLDIVIEEPDLCRRYCGIKVAHLLNNQTPLDMKIFLHYTGMRSINLFVDLTNYLMLELGQPMHAFDERIVKNITVRLAKDGDTYTTLDGVERHLDKDTLMISNGPEYFGIAGIMGGLDSEILPDTTSIFLESANFKAGCIRKSAVRLGLRTEASARYEKSLDPNMCDLAIKRFLYFLQKLNPDMEILSSLTDLYPNVLEEKEILLKKETLRRYTAIFISDEEVKRSLEALGFVVNVLEDAYVVTVPTYRATKDISMAADLIEEIVRLYGYDAIKELPLEGESSAVVHETMWDTEYKVKQYLATKWNSHEVHSYLWYETDVLNKLGILKDGVRLLAPYKNNLLRDDLSLSLLPIVRQNLKNRDSVAIFEIGTVILDHENRRHLSIVLANKEDEIASMYVQAKGIVESIFRVFKHKDVRYQKSEVSSYYNDLKSRSIYVDDTCYGQIRVFNGACNHYVGKKKCVVAVELYFDEYQQLKKQEVLFEEISKYPMVSLDYTVLAKKESTYEEILAILNDYQSDLIQTFELVDVYENDNQKKYTIRYVVGSSIRTLTSEELASFKDAFIQHIQKKGLEIVL